MLLLSLLIETLSHQLGLLEMLKSCVGKKYSTDFLVLGSPQDDFCPIIFGRPFLNIVNSRIDFDKKKLSVLALVMSLMILIFPSLVEIIMKNNCLVRMN